MDPADKASRWRQVGIEAAFPSCAAMQSAAQALEQRLRANWGRGIGDPLWRVAMEFLRSTWNGRANLPLRENLRTGLK